MYFCFCHSYSCNQELKIFESRNQLQEKRWTYEIRTRKKFLFTKYPQEKISDSRISRRKLGIHEIPTIKNFRPKKYQREKILDPREKNLDPPNIHEKKNWTHEIPKKARGNDGTQTTRPTIAHDPRNLAHSSYMISLFLSVFLSSSFSSTISTSLSLFLTLLLSLSPPICLILSLPLCLFKMSFNGDRSTSFPRK